jgi:hypothetical protein
MSWKCEMCSTCPIQDGTSCPGCGELPPVPSKPLLDADEAIGRVMECWHDVLSAPPSSDYHRGYNDGLEDAKEQLELMKHLPTPNAEAQTRREAT